VRVFACELKDPSKLDGEWSIFDLEEKKKRHETVFPEEMKKAFARGSALLR